MRGSGTILSALLTLTFCGAAYAADVGVRIDQSGEEPSFAVMIDSNFETADYWLVADAGGVLYSFDLAAMQWLPVEGGLPATFSGAGIAFPWISFPLDGLPLGTVDITVYFGIDASADGSLSLETLVFEFQTIEGEFTLAVEPLGKGSVTSDVAGINCGEDCEEPYAKNTTVVLTAQPTEGYSFLYWTGCDSYSESSCTVRMDANRTVYPSFGRPVMLQPELMALDESLMQYILKFDETEIHFSSAARTIEALRPGDIISGSYNKGFLRRVASVTRTANGRIVVGTSKATIADAVQEGTIAGVRQFTNADIVSSDLRVAGVTLRKSAPESTEFTLDLDTVIYREKAIGFSDSFDESFGGIRIKGSTSFSFQQDFGLDLCWCWNPIEEFRVAAILTNNNHLEVYGQPAAKWESDPIWLGGLDFGTYDVSGAGVLWLTPRLDFYVGLRAEVGGEVTAYITFNQSYHAGVRYRNDHGWDTISAYNKYLDYSLPSLRAYAKIEGYFRPELSIVLNGVGGPFINIEPYLGLSGDVQTIPVNGDYRMHVLWRLYAGLDAHVGVKGEILGIDLGKKEWDLLKPNPEWTLAQDSWDTDKPKASIIKPLWNERQDPNNVGFMGQGIVHEGSDIYYEWDFGDGTTSTERNVTHTYAPTSSLTKYDITLTVTDEDGASDTDEVSIRIDSQDPTAPENLSARAWTNDEGVWAVDLRWDPSTDNDPGIKYYVFKSGSGPNGFNMEGYNALTTDESWRDNTIQAGKEYCYKVQAWDRARNRSPLSNVACITPGVDNYFDIKPPTAPTYFSAVAMTENGVFVIWSGSTDNVGIAGYTLYSGHKPPVEVTGKNYFVDTGLSASTEYCYRVSAFDRDRNDSPRTDEACATTLTPADTSSPTTPQGLSAVAASHTQINLSWSASTDNVGIHGYKIYRNGAFLTSVNSTSHADTSLSPDTQYCYKVSAYDAAGNESAQSTQACATTTLAPDNTAPSTPQGVTAARVSVTQINLSWNPSTDNRGVTEYRVYRGGTYLKTALSTSTSDTGLTPNTTYCYRVTARDAAGNESPLSAQACATTTDMTPPSTPTGFSASANPALTEISLSWSASTDNVAVVGYRVYRDGTLLTTTASTSAKDAAITFYQEYRYRVSAIDAAGNESPQSVEKIVSTWIN